MEGETMLHPDFVKPRYDESCFSSIPQTITSIFAHEDAVNLLHGLPTNYDTVMLFLVDAFGWRFFEKYAGSYPFLKELVDHGVVSRITSQFPSTTAAHVTTIHTGLPVGQHGVFEWQFYEPQVDAVVAPLLFSFAGTQQRETLKASNIDPHTLFSTTTIYQQLQQHGVASYVFQPKEFAFSSYSRVVLGGATVVPYRTLPEALVNMGDLLDQQRSRSYFMLYFSTIDTICHTYGPASPQLEAEIDTFLTTLDRLFTPILRKRQRDTLFILTADHGQIEVDPQTTLYLNLDPAFADVQRFTKRNRNGELLVPGGSPRDMFLYIKDELLDEVHAYLAERLVDRAEVYKVNDLIAQNLFGLESVSPTFQARVGNLVILPLEHETVWWYEKDKFEQTFRGHHGGLTPQEMEIPLVLYSVGR
jgi:predicted AlkP superfamily pyrophosphatase or phosphodiesterase